MYALLFTGFYDVVNNLGSMAARFLFQPIEESGNIGSISKCMLYCLQVSMTSSTI